MYVPGLLFSAEDDVVALSELILEHCDGVEYQMHADEEEKQRVGMTSVETKAE